MVVAYTRCQLSVLPQKCQINKQQHTQMLKKDPNNKPNICPNNNASNDDDYDGYNAVNVTTKKSNA